MATIADLWDAPEVKPKGGASDVVAPKQKSFSTYKGGIEINESASPQQPQGATIADLWESTPAATPAQLKQQSGNIVGEAIRKGFETRKQLGEAAIGAGETALTALTGAVAAPLAVAETLALPAHDDWPNLSFSPCRQWPKFGKRWRQQWQWQRRGGLNAPRV